MNCFAVIKSCFRAASQSQQFLIIKSMSIKKRKYPKNNNSHLKKNGHLANVSSIELRQNNFFHHLRALWESVKFTVLSVHKNCQASKFPLFCEIQPSETVFHHKLTPGNEFI